MSQPCYCCSEKSFNECCGPVIQHYAASSPEELMRSRYSAFTLKDKHYLINTTWPEARPADLAAGLEETFQSSRWRGLKVIYAQDKRVEFCAFYSLLNQPQTIEQIHELSRFELSDGQWFYIDGKHLAPIKIKRNDACPCGSLKKFKLCCGN